MYLWIVNIVLDFLLCAFFAGIVIPKILLIAFRKNLYDIPNERKIHTSAVPRLGGIAFKPVIFFSTALLVGINLTLGHREILTAASPEISELIYGFCAIMVLYLIGMADDLIGVKYRAKFVAQIFCAVMLIEGGIYINSFHGLFGLYDLPIYVYYPFTILLIVFIINAINLIDGIDGLASGLCSVAFLFYGVIYFMLEQYIYSMLSFATLGVLLPFFYYNVFGKAVNKNKIFMGDTGSLTIGIMVCFMSIKLSQQSTTIPDLPYDSFILAFTPLIIPCFDVLRVYLHRIRNRKNPFLPDKNHIHHKLLAIGMKQRKAMISILIASTICSLTNIFASIYVNINLLIVINLLIWTLINIWLSKNIIRINRSK